ncbi:MAG: hypothetical protein MJA28_06525 [Gammaproteobacteria bacterium]|nr:hypothetical protein [Gammaproteobacteria bacterium]
MGVLSKFEEGVKKTGGALNVTRKRRLKEDKAMTGSEWLFLFVGILLGALYGFMVEKNETEPFVSIILWTAAGAAGGYLFGYLVDMASVIMEAIFGALLTIVKKTAPPLFWITLVVLILLLVVWAYTKQVGPIGSITAETMDQLWAKIGEYTVIIYENTILKLFNFISELLSELWNFYLNL